MKHTYILKKFLDVHQNIFFIEGIQVPNAKIPGQKCFLKGPIVPTASNNTTVYFILVRVLVCVLVALQH